MKLNRIILENFRYFEHLEVEFLPRFNVIIGNNGSGKSSLLEGISRTLSSFFLGIDEEKVKHTKFQLSDIRYVNFENKSEYQFPVRFWTLGMLDNQQIEWSAKREGKNKESDFKESKSIKEIAENLQKLVRKGEGVLPIISYFGANRLWESEKDKQSEEDGLHLVENESRFAAYRFATRPVANYDFLKKWFISKELATLQAQQRNETPLYDTWIVKKAIRGCVENCEDVYYNLATQSLLMKMTDGRIVRWNSLSDGQRNMLAIAADIAYRCINLNPHLKEKALETAGVVLIDEIDVHLHPNWQKKAVKMLKDTFPNIQFIVTTHSPLVLHSLELGDRVITLEDNQAYYSDNGFGRDANDTLLQFMDTSSKNGQLSEYLELVESGLGKTPNALQLRQEIEKLVGADYKDLAKADAIMMFYDKK